MQNKTSPTLSTSDVQQVIAWFESVLRVMNSAPDIIKENNSFRQANWQLAWCQGDIYRYFIESLGYSMNSLLTMRAKERDNNGLEAESVSASA